MKSIRDLYKVGKGPSSSHTMGPERAARLFLSKYPDAETYRVVLYGSLSKTGRGHGLAAGIEFLQTGLRISRHAVVGYPDGIVEELPTLSQRELDERKRLLCSTVTALRKEKIL